jgi:hypothetical protein
MIFTTIHRVLAIFVVLVSTSAFCLGDVSLFIESHWDTFSNAPCFQTSYSTTNLPSKVLHDMLAYARDGEGLTTNRFSLVWAATDGTNYVAHFELDPDPTPQNTWSMENGPLYYITAAIRETGSTNLIISTGPCWYRLDDYKQFIYYEKDEAWRKLINEIGH